MALVKVSLMSELAMLRLLRVGRRADNHYQQATQEYCAQLRELYLAGVRERRRRAAVARRQRKEASAATSETFKLTLTEEGVPGIALARSSLPLAERGDRVQLLRAAQDEGATDGELELLTRGVVLLANEQQVRIKFQEPLSAAKVRPKEALEEQAKPGVQGEGTVATAGDEQMSRTEDSSGRVDEPEQPVIEKQAHDKPEVICFRVKLELSSAPETGDSSGGGGDEYGQLIERVLHRFAKLKCNQALHRNLMGLYDERATEVTVSDRTRILPATAALAGRTLRPNGQQRAAIEQALRRRLTLIEGPAGSGKTLVGALIAANACRLHGKSRVLVCSPLQSTVDKLTELLLRLLDGHQQVLKLPENAVASARNPRLARRAPITSKRRSMPRGVASGAKRASIKLMADDLDDDDDDEDQYDDDEDDEQRRQHEANRAHLDKIVDDEIYLQAYARSKDTLGHDHGRLHAHAYRMVTSCTPHKRREMEAKMISRANVVCCTLVQAGSYLLSDAEFDLLILDDVQLTSELDCLVAIMTRGIKQVTLLSDTRRRIRLARSRLSSNTTAAEQAPAGEVATGSGDSTAAKRADSIGTLAQTKRRNGRATPRSSDSESESSETISGHQRSTLTNGGGGGGGVKSRGPPPGVSLEPGNLFERLLALGLPTVDLRVQYRCHATLSNFFNHHFYAGRLKDDRKTNEKLSAEINTSLLVREQNFAWMPNRKYLTGLFWASPEPANLDTTANYVLNKLLRDENIQESRIGVIYNRHSLIASATRNAASSHRSSDLKQATIDGFIGQERDFIIMVAGGGGGVNGGGGDRSLGEDEKSHLGLTSEIHCDFRFNDAALNWALTRAKLGLFLVAEKDKDEQESCGCGSWRELVKYYDTNKLVTHSTPNQ